MKNIQYKINKYQSNYVPGECRSKDYNEKIALEQKLHKRQQILSDLIQEIHEKIHLTDDEKILADNLIRTFNPNFKYLHRQLTDEAIILSFIIYQKKLINPSLRCGKYSICKKHGLSESAYTTIITRIAQYYMLNSPINIRQTTRYNHDYLIKNNGV